MKNDSSKSSDAQIYPSPITPKALAVSDLTPKERVFKSLEYVDAILRSGDSLESRRYELERGVRNALSWESELINNPEQL